jgi:HSP20 family protein
MNKLEEKLNEPNKNVDTKTDEKTKSLKNFRPESNIFRNEKEYYLQVNLPGVSESNAIVSLEQGVLTIEGKSEGVQWDDMTPQYLEFSNGNFKRSFRLDDVIDVDQIEAVMKNGVLNIRLPLKEPVVKKIPVQAF